MAIQEIIQALPAIEALILALAVLVGTVTALIVKIRNKSTALNTVTDGIEATGAVHAKRWIAAQERVVSPGAVKAIHKSVARAQVVDKIAREAASDRLR